MRNIGLLAIAGVALVALLPSSATAATAQIMQGGSVSGSAVGGAVIQYSLRIEMPSALGRVAGVPEVAGPGEAREVEPSVTAVALQTLAGAKWMVTRHIGLFFDYKLRSQDTSFSLLNATADLKGPVNHVFGGVAVHF